MKIVLLGAPGAGKGTVAERLCKKYNLVHISVGDILRENIAQGTEVGKMAEGYIAKGQLVPDSVIIKLVESRLSQEDCKEQYLLDGYPRNLSQAEALDNFDKITNVININVDSEVIIRRLTSRLICPTCGAIYNTLTDDTKVCRKCNVELTRRKDDTEEVIKSRLNVYENETKPVLTYYKDRKEYAVVDGDRKPEAVFADVEKIIL